MKHFQIDEKFCFVIGIAAKIIKNEKKIYI